MADFPGLPDIPRLPDDIREAIENTPIQFWTCVNDTHRYVTWNDGVAECDTCGLTSEMTRQWIAALREAVRADVLREMGIHPEQVVAREAGRAGDPAARPDDRSELLARIHAPVLREAADRAEREAQRRPVLTIVAEWLRGQADDIEAAGKAVRGCG